MRGRNRNGNGNKSQNPLSKVYESNGPDVKVRGTANHIADKYLQLARDSQSSGDPVSAENYYQHAEHYLRIVAAAQEQYRQINPNYRPEVQERDDDFDDEDDGPSMPGAPQPGGYEQPSFGLREPQPFLPSDQPAFPPREQPMQPQGGGHQGRYERRDDRRDENRRDDQRRDDYRRDEPRRDDQRRDDRRSRFERNRSERYGDRQNGRDGERNYGQQGGERYQSDRPSYDRPQSDRQPPERAQSDRPQPERPQAERNERPAPREIEPALDALPAFITGGAPVIAAAPAETAEGDGDAGERSSVRPRRRRRTPRADIGSESADGASGGSDPTDA
jgi:hypothetical protein